MSGRVHCVHLLVILTPDKSVPFCPLRAVALSMLTYPPFQVLRFAHVKASVSKLEDVDERAAFFSPRHRQRWRRSRLTARVHGNYQGANLVTASNHRDSVALLRAVRGTNSRRDGRIEARSYDTHSESGLSKDAVVIPAYELAVNLDRQVASRRGRVS